MIDRFFCGGPLDNIGHLLVGSEGLYIIDPLYPDQIIDRVKKFKVPVLGIINTHEHPDHIFGNQELRQKFSVPIFAHPSAKEKIRGIDRFLEEGDELQLGRNVKLRVAYTPGHTMTHITLELLESNTLKAIISGDCLFNGGVGNCKNGGDPRVLFQTFEKYFAKLDDGVEFYPSHDFFARNLSFILSITPDNGPVKNWLKQIEGKRKGDIPILTLGQERSLNLFLQLDRIDLKMALGLQSTAGREETFLALRKKRDQW